jgi:hypothetical protein
LNAEVLKIAPLISIRTAKCREVLGAGASVLWRHQAAPIL